jgi:GT2 family glycosyltransferase
VTKVSVVIPTWKRASCLDLCLAAVRGQDPSPNEIIVVGRIQDEAARAVAHTARTEAGSTVHWVTVVKPGHIAPMRRGLEMATGDIVAFVDDDAEPLTGWLAALTEPFSDSKVACVGGRVVTPGVSGRVHRDAGRIRWYGRHIGNVGAREDPGLVDVDGVMEGNWAWRRAVLAGLRFDPVVDFDDASMFGLDLCLQARALGYRIVYQSAAPVVHHAAPRSPELDRRDRPRRNFCYSRNYTYIALKHFSNPRRAMFLAWWWLVGDEGTYGFVRAVESLVRHRKYDGALARAAWSGKAEGWRKWRGAK